MKVGFARVHSPPPADRNVCTGRTLFVATLASVPFDRAVPLPLEWSLAAAACVTPLNASINRTWVFTQNDYRVVDRITWALQIRQDRRFNRTKATMQSSLQSNLCCPRAKGKPTADEPRVFKTQQIWANTCRMTVLFTSYIWICSVL